MRDLGARRRGSRFRGRLVKRRERFILQTIVVIGVFVGAYDLYVGQTLSKGIRNAEKDQRSHKRLEKDRLC